jgi:hypothetical protein
VGYFFFDNHPMGENLPNLVTLISMQFIDIWAVLNLQFVIPEN